jgi:hypothetical protein
MDGLPVGFCLSASAEQPIDCPRTPYKGRQRVFRHPHTAIDARIKHVLIQIANEIVELDGVIIVPGCRSSHYCKK